MREALDFAITLPQLDIVSVDELLRVSLGAFVILTDKLDRPDKVAVRSDDVHSVFGHLRFSSPNEGRRSQKRLRVGPISHL
jgi:hypothetical protein